MPAKAQNRPRPKKEQGIDRPDSSYACSMGELTIGHGAEGSSAAHEGGCNSESDSADDSNDDSEISENGSEDSSGDDSGHDCKYDAEDDSEDDSEDEAKSPPKLKGQKSGVATHEPDMTAAGDAYHSVSDYIRDNALTQAILLPIQQC